MGHFFHHQFHSQYLADNFCEQVSICRRCGYKKSEYYHHHQFGEWQYAADNSCEQVWVCQRDGYEVRRVSHQFGGRQYTSDACYKVAVCSRCHEHEYYEDHNWIDVIKEVAKPGEYIDQNDIGLYTQEELDNETWRTYGEVTVKRCARCGKE